MSNMIESYKDLIAWKKEFELTTTIYTLLDTFPKEEKFGLISQISRAVTSVPANIAVGWRRDSNENSKRLFIRIRNTSNIF